MENSQRYEIRSNTIFRVHSALEVSGICFYEWGGRGKSVATSSLDVHALMTHLKGIILSAFTNEP